MQAGLLQGRSRPGWFLIDAATSWRLHASRGPERGGTLLVDVGLWDVDQLSLASRDAVVAGELLGGLLQRALAQRRPVAAFEELLRWQDARWGAGVERGSDALCWPTSADAQSFLLRDAMHSPDGEIAGGYWEFLAVDEGSAFEALDGFADEEGNPNRALPTSRMEFIFESVDGGSRMVTTSHFASLEELEKLVGMGMVEGMRAAMGQIDDVLADLASFAAGNGTQVALLGDTQARITRIICGPIELVWRAHHEPDLLRRWQLGPDGWTMPVCDVATAVGETYRYEWENEDSGDRFGFTGTLLEELAPVRAVASEAMLGTDGPSVTNELTLTPLEAGTLMTLLCTYPDAQTRELILATGMADGMETSYARLEREVLAAG